MNKNMISNQRETLLKQSLPLETLQKTFIDAPTAQQGALVGAPMIKSFCGECREALFSKSVSLLLCAALSCGAAAHAGDVLLDKVYDAAGESTFIVPDGVTELSLEAVGGGGQGKEGIYASGAAHIIHDNVHSGEGKDRGSNNAVDTIAKFNVQGPGILSVDFAENYGRKMGDMEWGSIQANELKTTVPYGLATLELPQNRLYEVCIKVQWNLNGGWTWHGEQMLWANSIKFTPSLSGQPGCRGQFSHVTLSDLKGGDEVKVRVGAGGKDGDGEDTIVSVNGVEVLRAVGGKRECDATQIAAPEGFTAHYGNGGQGGASQNEAGHPGGNGAVKVSWLMPATAETATLMAQQVYALTRHIGTYVLELATGVEHANEVMAMCVKMACEAEPELAAALKLVIQLRDTIQPSREALQQALGHFENLLLKTITNNRSLIDPLFAKLLPGGAENFGVFKQLTAE